MNDIFVYYLEFPPSVKGLVTVDENSDYSIYINSIYNIEQQREIYSHEMAHILSNHHYIVGGIQEIELSAQQQGRLIKSFKDAKEKGLSPENAIFPSNKPPLAGNKIIEEELSAKQDNSRNVLNYKDENPLEGLAWYKNFVKAGEEAQLKQEYASEEEYYKKQRYKDIYSE